MKIDLSLLNKNGNQIFHDVVKKIMLFKNTPVSFTIVNHGWFRQKNFKNGDSKFAKNHQIQGILEKIPWLFFDFWKILQKFPYFSRFSLTFSKNCLFSLNFSFSIFSLLSKEFPPETFLFQLPGYQILKNFPSTLAISVTQYSSYY